MREGNCNLYYTFQVAAAYDELHPRTRAALLAVANTALKTSVFKLENEQSALLPWMEAAGMIILDNQ